MVGFGGTQGEELIVCDTLCQQGGFQVAGSRINIDAGFFIHSESLDSCALLALQL